MKIFTQSDGRKYWRGYLTQVGETAPVATVVENTLGGTIVWSYVDVGMYYGTLTGTFSATKTFVTQKHCAIYDGNGMKYEMTVGCDDSDNRIVVLTFPDDSTDGANSVLSNQPIEIIVVP